MTSSKRSAYITGSWLHVGRRLHGNCNNNFLTRSTFSLNARAPHCFARPVRISLAGDAFCVIGAEPICGSLLFFCGGERERVARVITSSDELVVVAGALHIQIKRVRSGEMLSNRRIAGYSARVCFVVGGHPVRGERVERRNKLTSIAKNWICCCFVYRFLPKEKADRKWSLIDVGDGLPT